MSESPIQVLITDDHAVVRQGIRQVLSAKEGFEIVAEAANGKEALDRAKKYKPDVIMLDISLPGESGLEIAARIRERFPEMRVLMLSIHDHPQYVLEATRTGVHGYVLKDATPAELRKAVRAIHKGETYFSPAVARQLTVGLQREKEADLRRSRLDQLTGRETDVLRGITSGLPNKQIAARLGISTRTVETHRQSLMRKLDLHSVAELTRFVMEIGLDKP